MFPTYAPMRPPYAYSPYAPLRYYNCHILPLQLALPYCYDNCYLLLPLLLFFAVAIEWAMGVLATIICASQQYVS